MVGGVDKRSHQDSMCTKLKLNLKIYGMDTCDEPEKENTEGVRLLT